MLYTGRLAPSPTGLLHLGHASTFAVAHGRARAAGGKLWLRDEDLDRQRARPEFAAAMREDLLWLGLGWDAEARQSDRLPLYRDALRQLLAAGFIYACTCSRRDLQQAVAAPHEDTDDEPVYTGRCRPNSAGGTMVPGVSHLASPNDASGKLDTAHTNYRFRVPDGEVVGFTDFHCGPQQFTAGQDFGDFLVWRKAPGGTEQEGLPSYQLACVVDDAAMGITEVVRGADLLRSTARQILLQRALGLPVPAYFHAGLLRDEHGARLAKRHDALSIRSLRERGLSAAAVLALAQPCQSRLL